LIDCYNNEDVIDDSKKINWKLDKTSTSVCYYRYTWWLIVTIMRV